MDTKSVFDYAKWFLENNLDSPRNTFKGNIKLQKLLFFSQLISLAKNHKLLFNDEFSAFQNDIFIENIMSKYKSNSNELLNYQGKKLSEEELEILNLTKDIYGEEDADTLTNMSQEFDNLKKYLTMHNIVTIPNEELTKQLNNIRDVLYAYKVMNLEEYKSMKELDYK